jgi:hypothetical protein
MRFAIKAVPLGALGCATAFLVACGSSNGLLAGGDANSLQSALSSVQSACAAGHRAAAVQAAQSFSDRVDALSPQSVDRQLIANLQQGAKTVEALATRTCTAATTPTTTTPTTTTPTTTVPTTTTPTTTTPTTTTPTTPTSPTTPTTTTQTTPPNGGGTPGNGNGNGPPGGVPPGQSGDNSGGAGAGQ